MTKMATSQAECNINHEATFLFLLCLQVEVVIHLQQLPLKDKMVVVLDQIQDLLMILQEAAEVEPVEQAVQLLMEQQVEQVVRTSIVL